MGYNLSYAWRSILNAKFLIRPGCRWCIGPDTNIPIYGEPWISNGIVLTASNVVVEYNYNNTMTTLIDPDTKMWSHNNVRNRFDTLTAEAIIHTSLLPQVVEDQLVWIAEKNDHYYSVKSDYRLYVEELINTSHIKVPGFWSEISRLKVPPKVKNITWRICRGYFPTRGRLLEKGIQCPSNCVVCNDNFEDNHDILLSCSLSVRIWRMSGLWSIIEEAIHATTTTPVTVLLLLQKLDVQQAALWAALVWSIWKHHNSILWNNLTEKMCKFLRNILEDWRLANVIKPKPQATNVASNSHSHVQEQQSDGPLCSEVKWKKPSTGID